MAGAGVALDRHPAIAVFAAGAQEQRAGRAQALHRGGRTARFPEFAARDVDIGRAGAGQLVKRDDPAQGPGAVGASARTAHHRRAFQRLRRQRGPDHPAAEGIVLGHPVERHQRPARGGRPDRAQADALGGGVLGRAGGAPEQRDARDLLERLIQPRLLLQLLGRQANDGKGRVARGRRQPRGGDDDGLDGRWRRRGVNWRCGHFSASPMPMVRLLRRQTCAA